MIDGLECESRLVSREKQGQVDCKDKEKEKSYGFNVWVKLEFWVQDSFWTTNTVGGLGNEERDMKRGTKKYQGAFPAFKEFTI